MIDWSRLKPYEGDQRHSFEELCYQITHVLYGHKGQLTSIDDSGGGDGVEFYLKFANGIEWGWQAKFYYPDSRLSMSSRKRSITESLEKALVVHPRMTKWFFCTPSNLTIGEKRWFDDELRKKVPKGRTVNLEHWGDSAFQAWMSLPQLSGKRNYFFGELELSSEWFEKTFNRQIQLLDEKYLPALHVATEADSAVHALLIDEHFQAYVDERLSDLRLHLSALQIETQTIQRTDHDAYGAKWKDLGSKLLSTATGLHSDLSSTLNSIEYACITFRHYKPIEISQLNDAVTTASTRLTEYAQIERSAAEELLNAGGKDPMDRKQVEISRSLQNVRFIASDILDEAQLIRQRIALTTAAELHVFGPAAVGKTHFAANVCAMRISNELPAIYLRGNHFTQGSPITGQILDLLDIPKSYNWGDFLGALTSAAFANRVRIPIVIDGINESALNGRFPNELWRSGLVGLSNDLAAVGNVVLITTCRSTYRSGIWESHDPPTHIEIFGFGVEQAEDAIERYFAHFRVSVDPTVVVLEHFRNPLYLRLFCETYSKASESTQARLHAGHYALFEVFDAYLNQRDVEVAKRLDKHPTSRVLLVALRGLAKAIWETGNRTIPFDDLVYMADGVSLKDLVSYEASVTKALLDEDLITSRDWNNGREVVMFTYDAMAGYFIAEYIISEAYGSIDMLETTAMHDLLFGDDYDKLHSLHEDVARSLAALLPMRSQRYLHTLDVDDNSLHCALDALFEIPSELIDETCVDWINQLFTHASNRENLFDLSQPVMGIPFHPFNASYWSDRLSELRLPERDVSWTEYVRHSRVEQIKRSEHFEDMVRHFSTEDAQIANRYHLLARQIMWSLSSTARELRDVSTRALYYYGRRYPEQFLDLTLESLSLNDPYIWERTLAALYGVAMAYHPDRSEFADRILRIYGASLYKHIFAPDAPYSTTHILARDYAKGTVEIALYRQPDLLDDNEQHNISAPFTHGGIREWKEVHDPNRNRYRDGNCPIDYILDDQPFTGLGVEKWPTTAMTHEAQRERKAVESQLWWRIYDLGYDFELLGEVDKWIARSRPLHSPDQTRIDHYGRKYARIAEFELAGYRMDEGLLRREWYDPVHRLHFVDIDPSFPIEPPNLNVLHHDPTKAAGSNKTWIKEHRVDWIDDILRPNHLVGGPWILLEGTFLRSGDPALGKYRETFLWVNSILVSANEAEEIVDALNPGVPRSKPDFQPPESYTLFAGEIPWCATFAFHTHGEVSVDNDGRIEIIPYGEEDLKS